MTPFTIHYRVARWSFALLPIRTFPPSIPYLTSISPLLIFITSIDWIVLRKRYGCRLMSTQLVAITRKSKRKCVESNTTANGSEETPNKIMKTVVKEEWDYLKIM